MDQHVCRNALPPHLCRQCRPRLPAPEAGAHTFEVLASLGIEGEELTEQVTNGVLG